MQLEVPLRTRQGHPAVDAIYQTPTFTPPIKPHITHN